MAINKARAVKAVEEAQERLEKAQTNMDDKIKAQQAQWEEEQEYMRMVAEIKVQHMDGEAEEEFKTPTQLAEEVSAQQISVILEQSIEDFNPQQAQAMGLQPEQMRIFLQAFSKHIIDKQAAKGKV